MKQEMVPWECLGQGFSTKITKEPQISEVWWSNGAKLA